MKRSALPLVRGGYGRVRRCLMRSALQASAWIAERYALPLSVISRSTRIPKAAKWATARRKKPTAVAAFSSSSTST